MPRRFELGDVVWLKATGVKCDVLGVAENKNRYFVLPRDAATDNGMWVTFDELDAYAPGTRPN